MKKLIAAVLCSLCLTGLRAENFTPLFRYFSAYETTASNGNWAVAQDDDGCIYFANDAGLLEYDAFGWILHPFASAAGGVRSLLWDSETQRLYAGGYEEFGYFHRDDYGSLTYVSLSETLEGRYEKQNDEPWNILKFDGKIYFQYFSSFFVYDGREVVPVAFNGELVLFFFRLRDGIYTDERSSRFCRIDPETNGFVKEPFNVNLSSRIIVGFDLKDGTRLLVTERDGTFARRNGASDYERLLPPPNGARKINRAILTRREELLLGTTTGELLAFNCKGDKLWELTDENGLPGASIENIHEDLQGNVWLAMTKGIAVVYTGSAFRSLPIPTEKFGDIGDAVSYNGFYYFGTDRGLFRSRTTDLLSYEPVSPICDRVWDLCAVDGQLFVGTGQNTYSISREGRVQSISNISGGMDAQRARINDKEVVVQSTYSDICLYVRNERNEWVWSHNLPNFWQPIRSIEVDYQGNIWCAHILRGLFRITLSNDLRKIIDICYFPSLDPARKAEETIFVHRLNNQVVFSNGKNFYRYDEADRTMVCYDRLNESLGDFRSTTRIQAIGNNQYLVDNNRNKVARIVCEGDEIHFLHYLNIEVLQAYFLDRHQYILPIGEGRYLFSMDRGFALYNEGTELNAVWSPQLHISSIEAMDSKGGAQLLPIPAVGQSMEIGAQIDAMEIICSYPDYTTHQGGSIHCRIEGPRGVSNEYTLKSNTVNLSALSPGSYSIRLQASDSSGKIRSTCTLQLHKRTHPMLSGWALGIYLLVMLSGLWLVVRFRERRLVRRNLEEQEAIRREQQQQLVRMENERLNSELTSKSKEIANYAFLQQRHNQVLTSIQERLREQRLALGTQYPKKYYNQLVGLIDESLSSQDEWKIFERNFDLIHHHFFRNLKTRYPELTSNDLHLCAYLRLNLSSKEIAELMNITTKGVEIARYRLRKKLHLTESQSLIDFMLNV